MTKEERKNVLHCLKVMADEEVCEECDLYGTTGTDHCEYDCVKMAIKALEQEPKTGYWRAIYQGDEIIDYRCSECEFGSTFGKSTYRMNYCPNCGARMVGE